jgi:hypothetical protein
MFIFICRYLDSTVSEDAGMDSRTVATWELAVPLGNWQFHLGIGSSTITNGGNICSKITKVLIFEIG